MPCEIGNNSIHCGPDRSHKCNMDGKGILLLSESPHEVEDTKENRKRYFKISDGGSSSCSICGRSAYSDSMWM